MKVTFCAYDQTHYVGGPNAWLRRLLPELRRQGVQSRVLFIKMDPAAGPTVDALRQQGFDCPAIFGLDYTEQRVQWILKKLAEDPPDVFVPNLMVPAYYAGRWVREAGIPVVGVLHSDDAFHYGLLSEFVFGQSAYQLTGLTCVSQFLEQQVAKQQPRNILVKQIPCGVPLPRELVQVPTQRLRLAYAGRLVEEQKRISEVTIALCRVVREVSGTEAVLYGDGPARPMVEQILSEQGKSLPVRLVGRVDSDQIQEHLSGCHVLVLLSDYEGLPIALMEGMACGLVPICLSMRSGVPELIEDDVTGLVVSNRDQDLIAAVRRLQLEPGLWERLSQAARARVAAEYSNEVCATRWGVFLQELRQKSGPHRALRIPRQLNLPPINQALAREDNRQPPHRPFLTILNRSRRLATRVKRRLIR